MDRFLASLYSLPSHEKQHYRYWSRTRETAACFWSWQPCLLQLYFGLKHRRNGTWLVSDWLYCLNDAFAFQLPCRLSCQLSFFVCFFFLFFLPFGFRVRDCGTMKRKAGRTRSAVFGYAQPVDDPPEPTAEHLPNNCPWLLGF